MIAIIECGTNLASVIYACERIGKKAEVTSDASVIKQASHVILPGVSTAKHAMAKLQQSNLLAVIRQLKQPVLGICLGMQIFYDESEEGHVACLGIMPGKITKLPSSSAHAVPHMGWNNLIFEKSTPLLQGLDDGSQVYFVHSYVAPLTEHTVASSEHGEKFTAISQSNHFFGVQFHPERSGKVGEIILNNFLNI